MKGIFLNPNDKTRDNTEKAIMRFAYMFFFI